MLNLPQVRSKPPGEEATDPAEWLEQKTKETESNESDCINIPKRKTKNGFVECNIDCLMDDQKMVVGIVMQKLHEFMTSTSLCDFKPLRMTVMGAGGTGKSVIVNTIVTLTRKMFNLDGVAKVAAPTGSAAFNIGGETLHHLTATCPTETECQPQQMKGNKARKKN